MLIDTSNRKLRGFAFNMPLHFLEAESLDEALLCASDAGGPDLIIMDQTIPGMNGLSGLGLISKRFPEVPVVIISDSLEPSDALNAVKQGAHGYIDKTVGARTLICALQLVMSGERYIPPAVLPILRLDAGDEQSDNVATAPGNGNYGKLTSREGEMMQLVANGYSSKKIARNLQVRQKTVDRHLRRAYRKLGAANPTHAVMIATQLGVIS